MIHIYKRPIPDIGNQPHIKRVSEHTVLSLPYEQSAVSFVDLDDTVVSRLKFSLVEWIKSELVVDGCFFPLKAYCIVKVEESGGWKFVWQRFGYCFAVSPWSTGRSPALRAIKPTVDCHREVCAMGFWPGGFRRHAGRSVQHASGRSGRCDGEPQGRAVAGTTRVDHFCHRRCADDDPLAVEIARRHRTRPHFHTMGVVLGFVRLEFDGGVVVRRFCRRLAWSSDRGPSAVDCSTQVEQTLPRYRRRRRRFAHAGETVGRRRRHWRRPSVRRIFIPYYTGKVIFDIIAWNSYETLMKSVMYMTLLSLASSVFAGFRAGCLEYGYVKVNLSIRRDLFCALLKQEIGFFDVNSTGKSRDHVPLVVRLSKYVRLRVVEFEYFLAQSGDADWFVDRDGEFILAFDDDEFCRFSTDRFGQQSNLSQNAQDSLANVCDVAEEVLSNIRTVKSFANEDGEVRRFQSKVQIITNIYKKKAIAVFGYTLLNELFSMIILVAVLWYGGHLVMVKKISSENLIPYLLYQLQLGEALISISGVYAGLRQAVGASKKVFELIDRKPEIVNAGKLTSTNVRGLVEFRNVSFSYPSRPHQQVLTNVSFKLNPGEMVALVGPSGGGKSSCIALLEHFYEPSSGQVLLDGVPVQEYDHKFFHKKVSLVSQEPVLFARSIRENISYGLEADEVSTAEIIRSAEQANASHFITLFADSFNTNVGEKGIQLSGTCSANANNQHCLIYKRRKTNHQSMMRTKATLGDCSFAGPLSDGVAVGRGDQRFGRRIGIFGPAGDIPQFGRSHGSADRPPPEYCGKSGSYNCHRLRPHCPTGQS
ncbi:putative ABC transporter, ATP-binding protein [Trichinella spiralis]|uniref:putative ABC transporter, ATP-binding protein n=1 Tax=Trichinella spiralis TaxID=6334 RepID=UPI0001EFDF20|nr:putative ABC transporter, ATP-binding protein [Trichinella spiralis]